jgi:thiamine biosynthesis lipoprotein
MHFMVLPLLFFATRAESEPTELRGAAQGTTYHIKYISTTNSPTQVRLQADVEKILADIDRQMSTYRPDSELSQFNRAPAGEWFPVSMAVTEVVSAAREISEKTGGALDVTVGPVVRLWHFGPPATPGTKDNKIEPPADAAIEAAQSRVGYKLLEVRTEPPALRKQVAGLEVDLSSIASGYTIDRLSDLLREYGIENFMIEIGGEVRAMGARSDGGPWKIAIERPLGGRRELQTVVALTDAAAATAGGTRKFFEFQGRRYSHIIDPGTGRPVDHSLGSVTVVADTCMAADGWDTPLLVLGADRGYECAEKNGIAAMFLSVGQRDSLRTTSAWKRRIRHELGRFEHQTLRAKSGATK